MHIVTKYIYTSAQDHNSCWPAQFTCWAREGGKPGFTLCSKGCLSITTWQHRLSLVASVSLICPCSMYVKGLGHLDSRAFPALAWVLCRVASKLQLLLLDSHLKVVEYWDAQPTWTFPVIQNHGTYFRHLIWFFLFWCLFYLFLIKVTCFLPDKVHIAYSPFTCIIE